VLIDPWQAVGLGQRLSRRGVRVNEYTFSAQSVGRLASTLFRKLRDHQVALPDDEELLDELANVRLRESSPGVLRMDHDPDKHDDRAIALALAAHALVEQPRRVAGTPSPWRRGRSGWTSACPSRTSWCAVTAAG
jgi:phage FluMu gp28-like protein